MEFQIPSFAPAAAEIFLLTMAGVILLLDLYLGKRLRHLAYGLSLISLIGTAFIIGTTSASESVSTFSGMFVRDSMGDVLKIAICLFVSIIFVYSTAYQSQRGIYQGEFFVLALTAVLGMFVMVSAASLLVLYLGLELLALSLYAMIASRRDSLEATEAAMKYFVLGALASGILLYGMSMLYAVTGTLDIAAIRQAVASQQDSAVLGLGVVFIVVAIGFKLGAVPFHMWVPDVYQGSPTNVTMFIGSAPKLAAFAMIMRLLIGGLEGMSEHWQNMLIVLALLSIGLGNVIAIAQTSIKRMLAYSAISHIGFFLLGIIAATNNGYASSMFYVLVYGFMTLGGFGVVLLLSGQDYEADELSDYKGLFRSKPLYALIMTLLMISMAGIPPLIGFNAKLMVIQSLVDIGLIWVAVVAVLFSVIGAFYYLRVVKFMFFDEPVRTPQTSFNAGMTALLTANSALLLLALPWIGALVDLCNRAIAGVM